MVGNNYFLGSRIGGIAQGQGMGDSSQPSSIFGRVIKVKLDTTTEILDAQGNALPIGAIIYRDIVSEKETTVTEYPALPLHTNNKHYPLPNEVVILIQGPAPDIQTSVVGGNMYYSTVINLWGGTNHNALPEPNVDISTILGKDTVELSDVNPLYPFPGDILTEGRQGQSIRIGGYKSAENKLVDDSNNGKPYILISNGQIKTDNGIDSIVEDINKDPNSIYFLSDHKVPLIAANSKRASYNSPPLASDQYIGNQLLMNGGRVFINAKNESVLISAKESVGINAKTVNIDAQDYACIDAEAIYLGAKARSARFTREPAVLGIQLENWLNNLVSILKTISTTLPTITATTGGAIPGLVDLGRAIDQPLKDLTTTTKLFQSKKVFTE